jgi:hypothetical protein
VKTEVQDLTIEVQGQKADRDLRVRTEARALKTEALDQ